MCYMWLPPSAAAPSPEGEVEGGGGGEDPSAPPLGTGVWAHETAGVLQKPIIEAPGPPPGCL